MTFDYTAAQLLVAALPDVGISGPTGRVDGVLPILQRLDWSSAETLHPLIRDMGTRQIVHDMIVRRAQQTNPGRRRSFNVIAPPYKAPFVSRAAQRRWVSGAPAIGDVQDLLDRLHGNDFVGWFESDRDQLLEFIDRLIKNSSDAMDGDHVSVLDRIGLRYAWDDRKRLRLVMDGFWNPFDRARIEATSAYTSGKPGLIRCDVCDRWFVPLRAGRPEKRCPGFECGLIAQRRYQSSPERREYRKLTTRLRRAEQQGDDAAMARARTDLDALKEAQQRGEINPGKGIPHD
jgi:hypothetical protein